MAVNFETTNWSLVLRANASNSEIRRLALAGMCEAYWYPLYSFARRRGGNHDDAADLTQAFLAHLIEKHGLEGLSPTQGKFRSFLLASFKNFQSDVRRHSGAHKRGGHLIRIPWDDELEARYAETADPGLDPEQHFFRQWAWTVINRARQRLRRLYVESGKAHQFDVMSPHLIAEPGEASTASLSQALGKSAAAARVALLRFRRRFGSALRAEVASTLENPEQPEQIEAELQFLLAALGVRDHLGR